MPMFSSRSNKGFYDSDITPDLPNDAVELSHEAYRSLQQAQVDGKVIDYEVEPPVARDFVRSPEQALAGAIAQRNELLREATTQIDPLQDAVDLGTETEKEAARLRQWKQFRVDVNRVDTSLPDPVWPNHPIEPA